MLDRSDMTTDREGGGRMSQEAAVLFANEVFYEAFKARDLATMELLWAEGLPVACIHPGWRALTTRGEVMESWASILGNPAAPEVSCRNARAFRSDSSAFVICYEVIGRSVLVATNIFIDQGGAWRLIHHQAGACNLDPEALEAPQDPTPVH